MNKSDNGKVLVLGASGKVGRMVRDVWKRRPPKTFTPIYQSRRLCGDDDVRLWSPDQSMQNLPRVHAILALWGVTPGGGDLDDNRSLAKAAMQLAREVNASRVLHCSSAAVYGPSPTDISEDMICQPAGDYGRAKLAMEATVLHEAASACDGVRQCLMRIGNVAGADSLFAALSSDVGHVTLDRFETGAGPLRSYIGPETLAEVFEVLLECPENDLPTVVNIAASPATAMGDLVGSAGAELTWRDAPEGAISRVVLDLTQLAQLTRCHEGAGAPEKLIAEWRRTLEGKYQ